MLAPWEGTCKKGISKWENYSNILKNSMYLKHDVKLECQSSQKVFLKFVSASMFCIIFEHFTVYIINCLCYIYIVFRHSGHLLGVLWEPWCKLISYFIWICFPWEMIKFSWREPSLGIITNHKCTMRLDKTEPRYTIYMA